ncbi:FtsX-like permease family protein [uncultured Friedmanniella sp.]|uniref:FtsX-like permease family protein n=1 Tax=uncultured Friedmanniella sp. TaxID=335381 RepID=UPI0035CAE106
MNVLVLLLVRGQRPRRLVGVAGCAGLVAALLLLAVAVLRLPDEVEEYLFPLLSDSGLRPGVVLALLLLTAPVLLLLYQLLRLGTTARLRRLAVLRVVGATPTQVRLLSSAELVVPALAGAAVLGPAIYALLRLLFGGTRTVDNGFFNPIRMSGGFVPVTVAPTLAQGVLVVVLVAVACGVVGWMVSRDVVTSAHALSRRAWSRRPRPWPLLLLAVAFAVAIPLLQHTVVVVAGVGLAAVGLLLSGPWIAARAGRRASERAGTVEQLLAGARADADPWAAGRAVAPVAVVGLVAAGAADVLVDVVTGGGLQFFFVISLALVALALLVVLTFVVLALATHGVETLSEHRRSTASLAAAGAPLDVLHRSLVVEARLLARPAATWGLVVGTAAIAAVTYPWSVDDPSLPALLLTAAAVLLLLLGLIEVAARAAARLVRPWLLDAVSPDGLRTE